MAINLGYRPRSLFWPLTAETHLLSTIKGAERRAMVESILNSGDLEALSAFITRSALEHDERTAFGRLHPSFMGGEYLPDLDEGEASSIRLALSRKGPALLLIDERAGRAVAQDLGLSVAGTAAVIGLARQRGLIPSARQVFAALYASDFRIAPAVIQAVLDRCGE